MVAQKKQHLWEALYPNGLRWDALIEPLAMDEIFQRSVMKFSDKVAIEFLGGTLTYTELGDAVERLSGALQILGIEKGDAVGLLLPNCPQAVIAYFAVLKIGAVVVNYNPLYTEHELEEQFKDSQTRYVITVDLKLLCDKVEHLLQHTSLKKVIVGSFAHYLPPMKKFLFSTLKYRARAHDLNPEYYVSMESIMRCKTPVRPVTIDPHTDMAVMQYTGGTTGAPKGAMLSHANMSANVQQIGLWFSGFNEGEETLLCVLPLFHAFAMTGMMNLSMMKGCQLVLHPKVDMKTIVRTMRRQSVTIFMGVPALFTALCHYKKSDKSAFASLKACISGGAPLPAQVKTDFEALSGCRLVEGYGLTETSPVALVNPIFGHEKPGSVGLPLPQTIVEIRAVDTGAIMPVGEVGEICLYGPQVMMGYYKRPKETAQILKAGRLHTGDLGYLDADGFLHIVDRIKEMILVSGFNVYPREIEEELYRHEAVEEAAVIGIADKETGQRVKAFIVLKSGKTLNEEALRDYLSERLTRYKLPKVVVFVESLPKTLIGKVEKKKLT